jgi:hypothetical protein
MVLFVFSPLGHAEIYKWTDENGKVHFSDNKRAVGKSKAEEVKINTSLNLIPTVHLPDSEDRASSASDKATQKSLTSKNKSNKAPVDHRCKLARQIINGEVALVNGLKTSAHEIKVAKRDISKFCN